MARREQPQNAADSRALMVKRQREADQAAAPQVTTTKARRAALAAIYRRHTGIGSDAQRQRMAEAIASGGVSTFEARNILGVQHPAERVRQLRQQGVSIDTNEVQQASPVGELTRVAFYVLSVAEADA